jgi:hypothetical protein
MVDKKDFQERRCSDHLCQESADRAVRKVFELLGVDIDKPESVEEFREDLRFGKKLRKAADHGFLAVVGLLFIALATLAWTGLVAEITKVLHR